MRTRVKICCIASVEEARIAVEAGADALGLVARMPSGPGPIPDEAIAEIAAQVPPPIATFLLTSEIDGASIVGHARRTQASVVQVVNHIDPAEWAVIARGARGTRRVQVIHVEDDRALRLIDAYAPHVHAFLLDSGRPGLAVPELGGTGRVHDWSISAEFVRRSPHPVFLAGGLDADNVRDAIRTVRPYGLDLCSSVRTAGALDPGKLRTFMRAVRAADATP